MTCNNHLSIIVFGNAGKMVDISTIPGIIRCSFLIVPMLATLAFWYFCPVKLAKYIPKQVTPLEHLCWDILCLLFIPLIFPSKCYRNKGATRNPKNTENVMAKIPGTMNE